MPDIYRHHPGSTSLEQAIGKTTGRGAGIECHLVADLYREMIESGVQFVAPPASEARRWPGNEHGVGGGDLARGLLRHRPPDQHSARSHQSLRFGSAGYQAPVDQLNVETFFGTQLRPVPRAYYPRYERR